MKKIIIASALLVSGTLAGYAQTGFGVEAGVNGSDYRVKKGGSEVTTDIRYGARFGLLSDLALSDNFYFQPGVYYLSGGYKMKATAADVETIIHTIQIPLNIQYKIGILGANRFFVGAGPYFSWNKDGTFHVMATGIDSRSDLKIGSTVSDQLKAIDLGMGVNAGYQITNGLFVRVQYQMGFLQLDPGGVSGNTIGSSGFCLSAGYLFYQKNKNGTMRINRDRTQKKEKK